MRALVIAVLLPGLAACMLAQAQPPTPVVVTPPGNTPAPVKVATIFGQNALANTQEGQNASALLTKKFGPRKEEYARKQAELKVLQDQLQKGQATMSAEARDSLNRTIKAKTVEFERLGQDSQAALETEEASLMQQLSQKLLAVIRDYATRNGYAVVFDVSQPNGPVLWASPSVDITNDVVKSYDEAHPVAATPPSPPPTKK